MICNGINLWLGDCLELSKNIANDSVDLILTDPPYGTIKGLVVRGWDKTTAQWDDALEPKQIYSIADRVLKQQRKLILFSQQPYTSRLVMEQTENIVFNYNMIWEKNHFAHGLSAKTAPVSYYEDLVVFYKKYDINNNSPLRVYFKSIYEYIGLPLKEITDRIGRKAEHCFYLNSTQFGLPTKETYEELTRVYDLKGMEGFKSYEDLQHSGNNIVFNLPKNSGHKSNIFKYKKDGKRLHPTQKPVALLEDLIRTFTNEGELVVDLTMGSGSTGLACRNTNRRFIGIEKDDNTYDIAKKRLDERGLL